jgi:hypothetical protein
MPNVSTATVFVIVGIKPLSSPTGIASEVDAS